VPLVVPAYLPLAICADALSLGLGECLAACWANVGHYRFPVPGHRLWHSQTHLIEKHMVQPWLTCPRLHAAENESLLWILRLECLDLARERRVEYGLMAHFFFSCNFAAIMATILQTFAICSAVMASVPLEVLERASNRQNV